MSFCILRLGCHTIVMKGFPGIEGSDWVAQVDHRLVTIRCRNGYFPEDWDLSSAGVSSDEGNRDSKEVEIPWHPR